MAALPPNLLIFNSNKKMVQLSKVVSNLKFTLDTCMFQISTFEDRFAAEFQDIFNNHESIISKINAEVKNHKDKIASENFKMYSQLHQKMQEQYYQTVESLTSSINIEQEKFIGEYEKLKKEISEITINLCNLISSLTDPLSDIFSNATCETIPVLRAKYQEELKIHDEESERKYNALKDEISRKMESYDLSYVKAVENLKKQFYLTTTDSGKTKFIDELKGKCYALKQEILKLKAVFTKIQKDRADFISDINQNYSNEISNYRKIFFDNIQQISIFNDQLETLDSTSSNELNSMNEKIKQLKEQHLQEITKLQSQIAQLLLDHKVEIDSKKNLYQSNYSFSDDEFNKLKEQFQIEISTIKEKYDITIKPLIENIENLQAQLNELLNYFQSIKNDRLAQFQAKKDEYSKEIAQLKDEQDDDLHLEYAKFESKMSVLMKKLGYNRSLIDDSKSAEETKNKLANELNNLKIQIEKDRSEFDLAFQAEKETLSEQNDSSLKSCQEEEEKKFLELQAKLNSQIEQNIKQHEERKNELILSLKSLHEKALNQVPEKFKNDNVISNMYKEYHQLYKSLQKTLDDEMKEVVASETNEKELQETISKKDELLSQIEKEKLSLLAKLSSNEEEENKHHNFMLSMLNPSHKDEEIEEYRKKCKDKISKLIQRQDDLLFILRNLKEASQGQNPISVSGYLEDEEVIKLRKLLEELRADLKNQRYNKKIDFEESISKKKEEIEFSIQKIQNYLEKTETENENKRKEKEIEIENCKKKAIIDSQEAQKVFDLEKESIKDRISIVQQKIDEKISHLNGKLKKQKIKNDKLQNNLKIEAEKDLVNNHLSITQAFEKYNVEINLLKEKYEEFEKRSKEQIQTYRDICQKSKEKAENIPIRPEEMTEIKRLENVLDQKTKQLTLVAKDLMVYKNRLKQQEDEYNRRFGVSPQVAILSGGDNRRQTKSAALVKKPLPPLKNSSVC